MDIDELQRKAALIALQKEWPQLRLLTPEQFVAFSQKRGLQVDKHRLQIWDQIGVLRPLIKVRRPITSHEVTGYDPEGRKIIDRSIEVQEEDSNREYVRLPKQFWGSQRQKFKAISDQYDSVDVLSSTSGFVPWSELETTDFDPLHPEHWDILGDIFYHPHQIFRLERVIQDCQITFSYSKFSMLEGTTEWIQSALDISLESLKNSQERYMRELILFLQIEDKYLPKVKTSSKLERVNVFDRFGEDRKRDPLPQYREWCSNFDGVAVREEVNYSNQDLEKIRRTFASNGRSLDPNRSLYLLLRHLGYDDRQKLTDNALLAWDHYDAAELIGHYLQDLTGQRQPNVDDLNSPSDWKKHALGIPADQINYDQRNALAQIVHHFKLDTRIKMLLLVEGETEREFIRIWFELRSINAREYAFRCEAYFGLQQLVGREMHQKLAKGHEDGATIIITADEETDKSAGTRDKLQELIRRNLIQEITTSSRLKNIGMPYKGGAVLWEPCFEDCNFTSNELLDAWVEVATLQNDNLNGKEQELKDAVILYHENYEDRTWIKCIEEIAKKYKIRQLKVELASCLARKYFHSQRPIVELLETCLHLAEFTAAYGAISHETENSTST